MMAEMSTKSLLLLALMFVISLNEVSAQSTSECFPMDVALVVPTSSDAQNFGLMKAFLRGALSQENIGGQAATIQIAVVKYRGTAVKEYGLGDHATSESILQAIDSMTAIPTAGNDVAAAMMSANSIFQATGVRTSLPYVAVIFYDGRSANQAATYEQAKILNDFGITIIAVGIGSTVDNTELSTIATQPSFVLSVTDYSQLSSQTNQFLSILCSVRTKLCPKQADIVLVLDESTSIARPPGGYDNWYVSILDFVGNITNAFRVSPDLTQFGIVKFSNTAAVSFTLNRYTNNPDLLNAIKTTLDIAGGETNIAAALRVARSQVLFNSPGARLGVKKVLFLITDGAANLETENTFTETNLTKAAGVEIFCIGITNDIDEKQLRDIASIPVDNHFFKAQDFSTINSILAALYATTCAQPQYSTTVSTTVARTSSTPTTTSSTTSPIPTSTTTVTTTVMSTSSTTTTSTTTSSTTTTTTTTTSTTTTPTTTTTTTTTLSTTWTSTSTRPSTSPRPVGSCQPVDVVFVIDASGSLDPASFPSIINFIISVISTFPIEDGSVQVGLVTFSSTQKLDVALNAYKAYPQLKAAIEAAKYSGQSSNKGDVLGFLRTTAFTAANGARDNVPHLAVLITNNRSPNQTAAIQQADLARRAGITILTMGLGNWLDVNELYAIGSFPKSVFNVLTNVSKLADTKDIVTNLICSKSNPCGSNPCSNGGVCSSLFGYYQCKCPVGFGGQLCDKACRSAGDVVFAIDSSGSIGPENWRLNIDFITKVVQNMDIDSALDPASVTGTRCAFIVYSDFAKVKFQLNSYTSKSNLLQGLQELYMAGTTNTADAIRLSIDECFTPANGDRPNVPNYLVVVTDGKSNNTQLTLSQAKRARNAGISVLAVGVSDYNMEELRGMASDPWTSNVLTAANYSSLSDELANKINSLLCSAVDSCTPNPCQNGATCTRTMGGYTCGPCPAAFTGRLCERACSGVVDLVLMLDVSGSINYDRFPLIKEFLISIVNQFDVNPTRTRVGALYFGDDAVTAFNLNEYSARQDVIQGIRDVPFAGGRTDIAAALQHLRTMYTPANGGRPEATHIVVIVTDAMINENADQTIPEGILVKNDNIEVVMVLIGAQNYVDMQYAEALVSGSVASNIMYVDSYSHLSNVSGKIIDATCDALDECSTSPCKNGGTCVNRYQRYACVCPFGSAGFNCDKSCTRKLDVVFVVDLSGSVSNTNYLVNLIRQIIYGLDVSNDQVHVGLITYATDVTNEFYLNKFTGNRDYLINAISFYQSGGTTNTQAALKYVLDSQLTSANGDRAGIDNVVIWISDGYSTVEEGSSPSADAGSQLKLGGATVYTIGVGDGPNVPELEKVASTPAPMHSFILASLNTTDIQALANDLLNNLCNA